MTVYYDSHGLCTISSNVNLDRFLYSFKTKNTYPRCSIEVVVDSVTSRKGNTKMGIMFSYDEARDELFFEYPWIVPLRSRLANITGPNTALLVTPTYRMMTELLGLGFDLGHVLEAIIQVKLLKAGFSLVHGACVDYKGTGVLLPAFANTGKTRTSLGLCRGFGFMFLSDDTTLVDGEAKALSYAGLTNLTKETVKSLGGAGLTAGENISLNGKTLLAKFLTTRFVQPGIYVPPEKLIGKVTESAKLGLVCFLEKGKDQVREVGPSEAISKMLSINRREIPWSDNPYLQAYAYAAPDFDLLALMHDEERIVGDFLRRTKRCYVVSSNSSHSKLVGDLVSREH